MSELLLLSEYIKDIHLDIKHEILTVHSYEAGDTLARIDYIVYLLKSNTEMARIVAQKFTRRHFLLGAWFFPIRNRKRSQSHIQGQ